MSRKDYQLIAETISNLRAQCADQALPTVVRFDALTLALAETFKGDNVAFSAERFVRACQEVKRG